MALRHLRAMKIRYLVGAGFEPARQAVITKGKSAVVIGK